MASASPPRPAVLCVLDGWGHRPDPRYNAILDARTPNYDRLIATCPQALIDASETFVGLPKGQMGNSEVGHMNLGAGRVAVPDLPRIDTAIADGSLVAVAAPQAAIPGITSAKGPNPRPRFDYGPEFSHGIISKTLPVALKDSFRVLVPAVDADGNETSGIRLPDIAVPTATSMGWAVRSANAGAGGELCYLDGSSVPFARTKAEREAKHDPRPSLEERYSDAADYAAKVQKAASALAQEGYLLPEDVERIAVKANSIAW